MPDGFGRVMLTSMREVLLNLTISLDGFIADRSGGIDWLMAPPDDVQTDYVKRMATVDTLIMGRGTYETSLALEGETRSSRASEAR